jgi:hypothetical protein
LISDLLARPSIPPRLTKKESFMLQEKSYAIPPDVLVAHLRGEAVLLNMETKRYYRLNDTAASIWRALEAHERVPGIVNLLCQEFEVSQDEARRETDRVVKSLVDRGLLVASAG